VAKSFIVEPNELNGEATEYQQFELLKATALKFAVTCNMTHSARYTKL
jgi:hypothetical protein